MERGGPTNQYNQAFLNRPLKYSAFQTRVIPDFLKKINKNKNNKKKCFSF